MAFVVTSLVLVAVGDPVADVWKTMLAAPRPRQMVNIVNSATVLYLSAIAVAVGFRMNLFNIGVDGQYRVAAFAGALFAGQAWLPGPLNVLLTIVVAMVAGGFWAGIAAYLKVTRGVSEVISTIMLNAIATGVVQWLLLKVARQAAGQQRHRHHADPGVLAPRRVSRIVPDATNHVYTLILLAALVGLRLLVRPRTRPGSASTCAPPAAPRRPPSPAASRCPRMVMTAMIISGALAGLVGMPLLFGQDYSYGTTFQAGLGFAGIGIALLGRNNADRHRLRRAAVGLPRRAVQRPADPGRRGPRARHHHPGRHPVRRRHRLRADPPRGPASRAAHVSPGSWLPRVGPSHLGEGARA